jgi:pimeloyl-ACP methyl ester carboxylesterase
MGNISRKWRWVIAAVAEGLSVVVAACATIRPASGPMKAISYPLAPEARAKLLVVLLPGARSTARDFARQGFIRAVRDHKLSADIIAADAHMGFYYARTFLDRLHDDVIAPAKGRGYDRIWLVGISIGGFGALRYAQVHPDLLSGVFAIAPFLGDRSFIEEIQGAGGAAAWTPPAERDPDDYQRSLWAWLKGDPGSSPSRPPIVLGYGDQDSLGPACRLLGELLPAGQVMSTPGAHVWSAWRRLWQMFLDSDYLTAAEKTSR